MTNAITPTSWFFIVHIPSQNETDSTSPSKCDFVFLLDSGACISVHNIPT